MSAERQALPDQGMRTYYAAHFVEQPGPGYRVRVVLATDAERLRAENEALKAQVASHRATAMERDDFLYRIGKVSREYEARLAELSGAVDEQEASDGA